MDSIKTGIETKKAWSDNWKEHSVERVLEIFRYPRVTRLLDTFRSVLPRDGKVLEGGCGLGPWVIKLRSFGYDVTGVDYDAVSIGKINAYDKSIPLYVSDVEKMPFKDGSFDAYMSLGVLEHFYGGPEKAIREAWRVLKPGGIFLITLPYLNILLRLKLPVLALKRNRFLRKLSGRDKKDFYYERYFKVREIKKLLEEGGFTVDKVAPVDHIFTFVSFSGIFRDKNTYDGENRLAVKFADFFGKIFPWQTAGSSLIVAVKKGE